MSVGTNIDVLVDGPDPSGFWESKLMGGYVPSSWRRRYQDARIRATIQALYVEWTLAVTDIWNNQDGPREGHSRRSLHPSIRRKLHHQ